MWIWGWTNFLGFWEEMLVSTTEWYQWIVALFWRLRQLDILRGWMKGGRRKRGVRDAYQVLGLNSWNDEAVSNWYRENYGRQRWVGSRWELQWWARWVWDVHQIFEWHLGNGSVQFSSVTLSCPTLCDPMNHSTPGLPVHHQLPEFTQTHIHRVSDAI